MSFTAHFRVGILFKIQCRVWFILHQFIASLQPKIASITYTTDKAFIATEAIEKDEENTDFRHFLKQKNTLWLDELVLPLQETITAAIDCTTCGACCKSLMINVTRQESERVSSILQLSPADFQSQFLEESSGGQLIMNQIPCHFLENNRCTIYEDRFQECRDFPHLHKTGFQNRLFGTLMHYGKCPIIYNVVEQLKIKTGFILGNTNDDI